KGAMRLRFQQRTRRFASKSFAPAPTWLGCRNARVACLRYARGQLPPGAATLSSAPDPCRQHNELVRQERSRGRTHQSQHPSEFFQAASERRRDQAETYACVDLTASRKAWRRLQYCHEKKHFVLQIDLNLFPEGVFT